MNHHNLIPDLTMKKENSKMMTITINDFATDEEIKTLWKIAERIIKEGHVYDDPNYKIQLNLITEPWRPDENDE